MKKFPFQMVWIGTDLPLATSGKTYVITGQHKIDENHYGYEFINNNGDVDSGASHLFARPKRKVYAFKHKNATN